MTPSTKQTAKHQFAFRIDRRRRVTFIQDVPDAAFGDDATISATLKTAIQEAARSISKTGQDKRSNIVYVGFELGDLSMDVVEEFRLALLRRIKAVLTTTQVRSETPYDGAFGIIVERPPEGQPKPPLYLSRSLIRRADSQASPDDTISSHLTETIAEPLTFESISQSIPPLPEAYSPTTAAILERTEELHSNIASQVAASHAGLRGVLRRIEGMSFTADNLGYRESFVLLDEMQEIAQRVGLLLTYNQLPSICIRRLPPEQDAGRIIVEVRAATDGKLLYNGTAVPAIKTVNDPSFDRSRLDFELARQRCLERFRVNVSQLAGYRPDSQAEATELIQQTNLLRRRYGAALGFVVDGDSPVRVLLVYSNGSFQLRTTNASRTHLFSAQVFPKLLVLDTVT